MGLQFTLLLDQVFTIFLVEQNARAVLQIADYGSVPETDSFPLEDDSRVLAGDPRVVETRLGLGGKRQE